MIPREILKKIRQIEIRTNRIVTETLAGRLFQPPAQLVRVPRAMPDRQDFDFVMVRIYCEINGVWPRSGQLGFSRLSRCSRKSSRITRQALEKNLECIIKPQTEPRFLSLVPVYSLIPFAFGCSIRNDPECHFLARIRFLISAETSAIGVPRPGCLSASSARRSSSATCSGVKSSSNLSRRCSKTSRCSSNGSFSICSKTWAALMPAIYTLDGRAQAAFPAPRLTPNSSRRP